MNKEELLMTNRIIDNNDSVIFMAENFGFLFSVDKKNGNIGLVCNLSDNLGQYRSFIRYKGNIILFPRGKGDVCIYNENDHKLDYINMPKDLLLENETNWSANYLKVDNYLFFYWANAVIVKYDLEKGTWKTYRDWIRLLNERGTDFGEFGRAAFYQNGKVFFHIADSHFLLSLDVVTEETEIIEIDLPSDVSVLNLLYDNNRIWILVLKKGVGIAVGSASSNDFKFEELCEINLLLNAPLFLMEYYENRLFLLPINHEDIYVVDLKTGIYEKLKGIPLMSNMELQKTGKYPFNFVYGEKIEQMYYCLNLKTGELVSLNMLTNEIYGIDLFATEGLRKAFVSEIKPYCVMHEGDVVGLEDYISSL